MSHQLISDVKDCFVTLGLLSWSHTIAGQAGPGQAETRCHSAIVLWQSRSLRFIAAWCSMSKPSSEKTGKEDLLRDKNVKKNIEKRTELIEKRTKL